MPRHKTDKQHKTEQLRQTAQTQTQTGHKAHSPTYPERDDQREESSHHGGPSENAPEEQHHQLLCEGTRGLAQTSSQHVNGSLALSSTAAEHSSVEVKQ